MTESDQHRSEIDQILSARPDIRANLGAISMHDKVELREQAHDWLVELRISEPEIATELISSMSADPTIIRILFCA